MQGRQVWEEALADPDSLAELPQARAITATDDDFADCEDFLYVANHAWERITGEEEGLDDALHVDLCSGPLSDSVNDRSAVANHR